MKSDDIEEALQLLLGSAASPPGIVITLRRHDEYDALLGQIDALEKQKASLEQQVFKMSQFASMYLAALDDLKHCRTLMKKNGLDTSFIRSLR